jgi:hypothetical protein
MRGAGGKILSRHPTPALCAELDIVPESVGTIQLLEKVSIAKPIT